MMHLSGHMPRVITGLILAASLVTSLLFGGLILEVVVAVVAVVALGEFYCMFWPGRSRLLLKAIGLLSALPLLFFGFLPLECRSGVSLAAFGLGIPALLALLAFLVDYGRGNEEAKLEDYAMLLLGVVYIPFMLFLALRFSMHEQFLIIVAVVASDTAAYYTGCTFGKHKIWPRVSPKKSWEGAIGGFIACIIVTALMGTFFVGKQPHASGVVAWMCIGALLNIAAQLGDFFESALKRSKNVKDSSTLLPGHGGLLDRIDSLLFAAPAYAFITVIFTVTTLPV